MLFSGSAAEAIAWLATADGQYLLAQAMLLPDDRLTRLDRLRKLVPAPLAAAAVEMLELRRRARAKFTDAQEMFFTREGLEQATGERIAAYRADHFREGAGVLDACSGIGGDACALAKRGRVIAVDRNPAAAQCTHLNASRAGVENTFPAAVRTLCADVTTLPLARLADSGIKAAFFDPSRRADARDGGRRRLRSAEDYAPPLSWLEELRVHFSSVAAKVSPAIDDEALQIPGGKVEFLSDRGECKEAALWLGEAGDSLTVPEGAQEPYFATVLRAGGAPATLSPFRCPDLGQAEIGEIVYEPDPAVIRAHLVPQLAALLDAASIEPGVAYLTAAQPTDTPFATAFRVVEWLPYHLKEIQRRLRLLGAHICTVKKRGVPFDPASVQKALSPGGDRALELILMRRSERAIAILCERLPSLAAEDA